MADVFINIPTPISLPVGVTEAEVSYLDGTTSNIQTQLDAITTDTTALKVEAYAGMIETPEDKTYIIDLYSAVAGTINTLKIKTVSGTCTAAVKINGTSVTGISAVSVTSTIATGTASAANTFAVGDTITLVISSNAASVDLQFTIKYIR